MIWDMAVWFFLRDAQLSAAGLPEAGLRASRSAGLDAGPAVIDGTAHVDRSDLETGQAVTMMRVHDGNAVR